MPSLDGAVGIHAYAACVGFLVEKDKENATTGKFIEI